MPRINRTFSQKQKPRKGKESSFVFWGEENQLSELIFIFQICLVVGSNNVWKCGDLIPDSLSQIKSHITLIHTKPKNIKKTHIHPQRLKTLNRVLRQYISQLQKSRLLLVREGEPSSFWHMLMHKSRIHSF